MALEDSCCIRKSNIHGDPQVQTYWWMLEEGKEGHLLHPLVTLDIPDATM
jgi:hypothetical protein